MSGIAGIVLPPGRAVDERSLRRMAASMIDRGPDGVDTWIDGRVGFAHAVLRTGESPVLPQPATLDGSVWITADARVDGRAELVRRLEAAGRRRVTASDEASRLILHAYHAWGEACVDHLLGDFAFAIWDGRAQRLFCARDHFGIKPFYYAEVDGAIVFSNTLECIRLHPGIGDTLNELAVADFLLFGCQQDLEATTFARIRRLPPAHTMHTGGGAPAVRRYWNLPAGHHVRYRKAEDYVDRFRELVRDAVDDRIRDTRPAIWLSGGLDSTTIAATARQLGSSRASFELHAFTVGYESLFRDEERQYAEIAARAIGISTRFLPADGGLLFGDWGECGCDTPEPIDDPFHTLRTRQLREVAAGSRVALAGDGGDESLSRPYVLDLIGKLPTWELAADLTGCVVGHRLRPALGLRAKAAAWRPRRVPGATPPRWLNPDFVSRYELHQRFARATDRSTIARHTLRPDAYRRLSSPLLHAFLEGHDPGITRVPLEHRWPLLDLRLVNYVLAIPPLPWCVDKRLMRLAMRGALPDVLLRRSKSPLGGNPVRAHLQTPAASWIDRFEPAGELSRFVNRDAIPPVARMAAADDPWVDLRPLCLNYWLSREQSPTRKVA